MNNNRKKESARNIFKLLTTKMPKSFKIEKDVKILKKYSSLLV